MTLTVTDDAGRDRAVSAVLFDMDGTIVDSIAATERIWRAWAEANGVGDRLVIAHGQPAEATIRAMLPNLAGDDLALAIADQQATETQDLDGVLAAPGALDLIAWLDAEQVPWAVVTSANTDLALARLTASGISPQVLVSIDDVDCGKPHPEPYLTGAARLAVPIAECLVVEDTTAGTTSGREAGAITAGLHHDGADLRITDLVDLRGRLRLAT